MPETSPDLAQLYISLQQAQEQRAQWDALVAVRSKLIADAVGFNKPEGGQTFDTPCGKVEVKQPVSRRFDQKKWRVARASLTEEQRGTLESVKYDPKAGGWKTLKNLDRAAYDRLAASCLTSKPGRVAVSLKDKAE
ncbi:MAG: hypothetical protein GY716_15805 [bacterium]|nr:hypothetical protein [bacterium]